jgi:hypothetical protein
MKNSNALFSSLILCAVISTFAADPGFVTILDAASFPSWHVEGGNGWSFTNGELHGQGGMSHIFSPGANYANIHIKAEVKINDGGNSGMYFRVAQSSGWPSGYEAQIQSSPGGDAQRTGSIYNFAKVSNILVGTNTWFNYEVIAQGNHLITKINGTTAVDFVDANNTYTKGHIAFQQHNDGSEVWIRNVQVKDLSATSIAPGISFRPERHSSGNVELFRLNGRKCSGQQKLLCGVFMVRSTDPVTGKTEQRLLTR